jgi:hypothetical protein
MRDRGAHVVLDPATFGATGLDLSLLLGLAINDPESVLPRGRVFGRGWETKRAWQYSAVIQVLKDNGVDVHAPATGPMVKPQEDAHHG